MEILLLELLYNVEYLTDVLSIVAWWIHEFCCYEPVDYSWFDPNYGVNGCLNLEGLF